MEPSFSLPPLEFCLGVSPNHAAKSRPVLNTLGSGTLNAITDAISTPMPGISSSRRLVGFCLCAPGALVAHGLDRLVETFQMLGQASHGRFGNLRKFRVRLCQRQQFIDASDALGNDNAEFGKMAAKRVNTHGALLDEHFPGLVQHQHGLLIRTLDRHETHARPRHRLADRRRVDRVILAPLDVGLDVSRRYQHHFVPHRHELAGPIMSGTARLHTDPARLDLLVKLSHLRSLHLTRDRLAAFTLQAVNLKIGLAKINRCSDKLLHGRLPSVALRRPRFGTRCRLSEAVHTIIASQWVVRMRALQTPSFRGDANGSARSAARWHRTRNLEIPGLVLRTIPE